MTRLYLSVALVLVLALALSGWTVAGIRRLFTLAFRLPREGARADARRPAPAIHPAL
jgi:hypothetical protein